MLVGFVLAHFGIVVLLGHRPRRCSGVTSAGTVSERHHVRTLNPYSRMALAVRGWGLEVALGARDLRSSGELGGRPRRRGPRGPGPRARSASRSGAPSASRDRLAATLRDRATRRWFSRVLVACEVISRRGQIPRVEGTELIPAGQRLRLRMPPGFSAELDREAAETLAATIGAREVRVVRDADQRLAGPPLDHLARSALGPRPAVAGARQGRCGSRSPSGSTRTGTRSRSACPSATCSSAVSPGPASRSPSPSSSPPPRSTPPCTSPSWTASRWSSPRGRARPSTSSGPTWATPSRCSRTSAPRWTGATRCCSPRVCARSSGTATSASTSSPSTSSPSTCAAGPRTSGPSSPRRCAT